MGTSMAHTHTHMLLTFKAYRCHLYPSPLIPVVLQCQQVCRPLLKTTPRTHMYTQRHAHKHTHRVTCSLSGRARPYASCSLELHICLVAVNRRSRCFHMDTQRADSDPCATWTKPGTNVSGFKVSVSHVTYIHLWLQHKCQGNKYLHLSVVLGEHTCASSGFLLFSFPILTEHRRHKRHIVNNG